MADKTYTINMPRLSDTMTEGVVVSWEKDIGDKITRGDIVATVETDKAIMDVEVFREGHLSGPRAEVGATVPVGDPIAYLAASREEAMSGAPHAAPRGREESAPEQEPGAESTEKAEARPPAPPSGETQAPTVPEGVIHTIKMPQLSDTMTEGIVVAWSKQPGERITRGDVVAQVETDKAIMDVEVFREGFLSGPIAAVDSTVPVGGVLAYLVEQAEQVSKETAAPAAPQGVVPAAPQGALSAPAVLSPGGAPAPRSAPGGAYAAAPAPRPAGKQATPYARKLAGELGVDLNALSGSGAGGEIRGEDVQRAHAQGQPAAAPSPSEVPVPGEGRPMSSMERAISRTMSASLGMPTFHVTVNARPEPLIRAAKAQGVSVTVAIARACALAIAGQPRMNWAYQPVERLVERTQVDIGMAVAADDGGLVVPVLRGCESRPLAVLNEDWKGLVERARVRRLAPEEFAHPTFMVSNMGMLGVSQFDAIPTPGQAAILAIASAGPEGMPLTITADHRVVNGAQVAMYLNALKQTIEHPDPWMGPAGPAIPAGEWDYDVVVIGGGPGGEECARDLAGHGIRAALINDAPFPGGECLWRGCIPSKAWRAAADRIRDRVHDRHLGVEGTAGPALNWELLERTRRNVLETRGGMALKTDTAVHIKFIQGRATFVDEHAVFIDTSGNTQDPHRRASPGDGSQGERIRFGCAVIATGAPPFVPPIEGAREALEGGGVLTSDTVWGLERAPARLVVVGGGAIGVEMAQIFQDFGSEVILLEAQERILAEVEPEIAGQLSAILDEDPRLAVHTGVTVQRIAGRPGAMQLAYRDSRQDSHTVECDFVLLATGKRPDLEPLKLGKAGVAVENGVIKVDASCRTSLAHIFAVGDVIGGLMLAHTAGHQGRVAAATIAGETASYDPARDCGVIFTRPQAAFAGLSAEQARARGIEAVEVKVPMSIDAKAMISNETQGMIKLVADKVTRRIVGVHFLADHADTLIGEAVMMVAGDLTLEQVATAIHPHPTQTELFGEMARRLLARLRRSRKVTSNK